MTDKTEVHVVAGILFNEQGHFLLSSRPEGKAYAGYWEFAGGKVEVGESEFDALKREFKEELDIQIEEATPWLTKRHEYEHACVNLRFFKVHQWHGKIDPQENQTACWQDPDQPNVSPMLPANEAILKALRIPRNLSGSLNGIYWEMGANHFSVLPFALASETDGLLLTVSELRDQFPHKNHLWVFAEIETLADIDLAITQNVDALIFTIHNQADVNKAQQILLEGTPLVLYLLNMGEADISALMPLAPNLLLK